MIFMFVITHRTRDYGDAFVVRRWIIVPNGFAAADVEPHAVCGSLEAARLEVPPGLVNIGRADDDDPVIVEVWT